MSAGQDTPLREFRKANGRTLAELARAAGISEAQLSRIERFGGASLSTALRLAELTGLPASAFARTPEGRAA